MRKRADKSRRYKIKTMAIYLALETSCDETAAAVVADGRHILSNCLISQTQLHQNYGGVVPEVAAREHLTDVNNVIEQAMQQAKIKPADLDGIACTVGPGLIGTLLVGIAAAKALAFAWDLPLIGVDHLVSHICANYLESELKPPFLALLVSGGHTQLMYFNEFTQADIIGQTIDDAAGEAFDKVARLLGLGYPGGPAVDSAAISGDKTQFKFPRATVAGFNFSFSGLKTAVLRCLQKLEQPWPISDLAASFQETIVDTLVDKTLQAQVKTRAPAIVLAGGVAANSLLRRRLTDLSPVPVFLPRLALCTDNAAMVASAAYFTKSDHTKCLGPRKENAQLTAYSRSRPRR
jgi:N6-L-threonylcarbamoyladenine synthase